MAREKFIHRYVRIATAQNVVQEFRWMDVKFVDLRRERPKWVRMAKEFMDKLRELGVMKRYEDRIIICRNTDTVLVVWAKEFAPRAVERDPDYDPEIDKPLRIAFYAVFVEGAFIATGAVIAGGLPHHFAKFLRLN
ncbi:MAG: hypothetical protein DRJ03_17365 [Chloroflexi bacterium]|nr:MAG: hypothetical protein DRJ03_17365 [Chloroflexota bacterium]